MYIKIYISYKGFTSYIIAFFNFHQYKPDGKVKQNLETAASKMPSIQVKVVTKSEEDKTR